MQQTRQVVLGSVVVARVEVVGVVSLWNLTRLDITVLAGSLESKNCNSLD